MFKKVVVLMLLSLVLIVNVAYGQQTGSLPQIPGNQQSDYWHTNNPLKSIENRGYYQNHYQNSDNQRLNPFPQSFDDKSNIGINRNYGNDYGNDYETQNFDYSDISGSQGFDPFKFIGDGVGDNLDYSSFTELKRA